MPDRNVEPATLAAADAPADLIEHNDRIAYQFSAIVQAHAALLVFDPAGDRVVQTSANLGAVLGSHPDDALGRAPLDLFDPASADAVQAALRTAHPEHPAVLPGLRAADARPLIGRVHRAGPTPVLEIEPAPAPGDPDTLDPVRLWAGLEQLAADLSRCDAIPTCAGVIARNLRVMIGSDRCMVYRFDEDWNGEVIGEDRGPIAADSFLGLRFPARDIPRSARDMLAAGPVRVTSDQLADPAPLVPRLNPITGRDLDLTHTRCRATDGVCRTYYKNMGVRSTLVMPLLLGGRLWGLISCHHAAPLHASALCDAPLSVARRLADLAIEVQTERERRLAGHRAADIHRRLARVDPTEPDWIDRFSEQVSAYRRLINADACIVRVGDQIHTDGPVPTGPNLDRLLSALLPDPPAGLQATNRLGASHAKIADLTPIAAGALAVPLLIGAGDAVVWLRREQTQHVAWAGDPTQGNNWDAAGGPSLTPRSSFKLWQQAAAGSSHHWSPFDCHVAQTAAVNIGTILLGWQTAKASRTKSEFLANMSHEIRTPMTAILGFADMLAEDETDPQRADFLATIKRNGAHLLGILNDILDLSKIEAGRMSVVPEPVDPRRLLEDCRALLAPMAEPRAIHLSVQTDPDVPATIRTDPLRLRQILLNIMGNAVKFTPKGSVTVRVRPESASLIFEVIDTGIGMTPEQAARVLQPFEQADAGTTRAFGGTGLGLTISARLIAALGGDLRIESVPQRGTTMFFRIDDIAARQAAGDHPHTAPPEPAPSPAPPRTNAPRTPDLPLLTGVRILVAEDGADNRTLIAHHLRRAGADTVFVEDGQQAVEAVRTGDFALILMDMQMPRLDGFEATRCLRAMGVTTPIIALTAHDMTGDRERCIAAGCSDFHAKPIIALELIACCARWAAAHANESKRSA